MKRVETWGEGKEGPQTHPKKTEQGLVRKSKESACLKALPSVPENLGTLGARTVRRAGVPRGQ